MKKVTGLWAGERFRYDSKNPASAAMNSSGLLGGSVAGGSIAPGYPGKTHLSRTSATDDTNPVNGVHLKATRCRGTMPDRRSDTKLATS